MGWAAWHPRSSPLTTPSFLYGASGGLGDQLGPQVYNFGLAALGLSLVLR